MLLQKQEQQIMIMIDGFADLLHTIQLQHGLDMMTMKQYLDGTLVLHHKFGQE